MLRDVGVESFLFVTYDGGIVQKYLIRHFVAAAILEHSR